MTENVERNIMYSLELKTTELKHRFGCVDMASQCKHLVLILHTPDYHFLGNS